MTELEKAARQALEALEETRNALAWFYDSYPEDVTPKGNELLPHVEVVLADLRRALEQPAQQEPVAVYVGETWCGSVVRLYDDLPLETPLYTRPQAREPEQPAIPPSITCPFCESEHVPGWLHDLNMDRSGHPEPEQPAQQQEPVAWRDHVEQRLLTWRQSFVNKSGDQLALGDFMDKRSLDDLIDFVCSEYTRPQAREPLNIAVEAAEFGEWFDAAWAGDTVDGQVIPTQGHADYAIYMIERTVAFGAWMAAKKAANGITGEKA